MSLNLKSPSSGDAGLPSQSDGDFSEIAFEDLDISEDELGSGAFGAVFRANYFGTEVAIKKMKIPSDSDLKKFMRREVIILKSMRHPHVVQFVGVCKTADSLLIITEYVKGGDLHQCLKGNGNLYGMWKTKLTLAQQIASAMSYVHSKKIIFRDLKGKNVLVNDKNNPAVAKICDFGFARVFDKALSSSAKSNYLTICGTDDWMAPEVILGIDYDDKSDVFSYGVLLLEFILGTKTVKKELKRHPYQAFELNFDKVRALTPKSCPAQFIELAIFCCAYDPKNRPDFKSVVMAITKIMADPKAVDLKPEEIAESKQHDDATRASLKGLEPQPDPPLEPYDFDDEYKDDASYSTATSTSRYELNDLYSQVKGVSYSGGSSYRSTASADLTIGSETSQDALLPPVDNKAYMPIIEDRHTEPVLLKKETITTTTSQNNLQINRNDDVITPTPNQNQNATPIKNNIPPNVINTNEKISSPKGLGFASITDPLVTMLSNLFASRSNSNSAPSSPK